MFKRNEEMLELTREGLDCIDMTLYINIDESLADNMEAIQQAFQNHSMPYAAIEIFSGREFHNDPFFYMDEEDFEEYLLDRYPDEGLSFAS